MFRSIPKRAGAPSFRHLLAKGGVVVLAVLLTLSCTHKPDPGTVVVVIESSPANLDPRVGIDAQSERIGELIFDSLVHRDEHFNLQPRLAERWETPDPRTWIFHIRSGVKFHDGRPLTAHDVHWTLSSVLNSDFPTPKRGSFEAVERVEAPDDRTLIIRLKRPWSGLLWNLSIMGIVPQGSGKDFNRILIGTGPFRFVSAQQDQQVVIERNAAYWNSPPRIERVRFMVAPDANTRALELRKGSADVAINSLSPDMTRTMQKEPSLVVTRTPGTIYAYLALNLSDPILSDVRVRQAMAYAIDRQPIIHYLWRDMAQPAKSILPTQSWAYNGDVAGYSHDPARARVLLDEAGHRPATDGVRFHLTMKTSTDETSRLLASVLQQQLRDVGIALDIRSYEFATFFSDVTKGAFQMYSLRWIGGNNDPAIFEYVFDSGKIPPKGANRGRYRNPQVDALIAQAEQETNQQKRRELYAEIQRIVASEQPYINLWYLDNVVIHSKRVSNITLDPAASYDFLKTVELN